MNIENFLKESPVFVVDQAYVRICGALNFRLRKENLNILQALVLLAVFFEKDQPVRPSQLAVTFGATRTNVSHCLSHLESLRLIRRELNPEDSRSYLIGLKPDGRKVALRIMRIFHRTQEAFEKQAGSRALKGALSVLTALKLEERV